MSCHVAVPAKTRHPHILTSGWDSRLYKLQSRQESLCNSSTVCLRCPHRFVLRSKLRNMFYKPFLPLRVHMVGVPGAVKTPHPACPCTPCKHMNPRKESPSPLTAWHCRHPQRVAAQRPLRVAVCFAQPTQHVTELIATSRPPEPQMNLSVQPRTTPVQIGLASGPSFAQLARVAAALEARPAVASCGACAPRGPARHPLPHSGADCPK